MLLKCKTLRGKCHFSKRKKKNAADMQKLLRALLEKITVLEEKIIALKGKEKDLADKKERLYEAAMSIREPLWN